MPAVLNHPVLLIAMLFGFSILPLLVVMGTAFLKLSIVFSLLRNALGIQQIPPNMAMYAIALILTIFIMAPVGVVITDNLENQKISIEDPYLFQKIDGSVLEPYRQFLLKSTDPEQLTFFSEISSKIWPEQFHSRIAESSLAIMLPAFAVSQLIEGFKIGLLLYLPFIAIDLIVSNILLAMGMMMVSPMTIAMPFKLLIFVLMGGWQTLFGQLILSYA